jgi:hypothetical protein
MPKFVFSNIFKIGNRHVARSENMEGTSYTGGQKSEGGKQ